MYKSYVCFGCCCLASIFVNLLEKKFLTNVFGLIAQNVPLVATISAILEAKQCFNLIT